jgi:hypothetical protein
MIESRLIQHVLAIVFFKISTTQAEKQPHVQFTLRQVFAEACFDY